MSSEIEDEIDKLRAKKVEIVNKINLTSSFDEKEEYTRELEILQKQIDVLEKLKK